MLIRIFRNIRDEGLFREGIVTRPRDMNLFVRDFNLDRMSDLLTNLLRDKLCEFTENQCDLYDIEMSEPRFLGYAWDPEILNWVEVNRRGLYVNGEQLLLVPKIILARNFLNDVGRFINSTVFEWRKKSTIWITTQI